MKFIVSMLLIALLSFCSGLYLPWWWGFALMAFAVSALIPQRPGAAFICGFLALLLLWGGLSWWLDSANHSLLSRKIAMILPLKGSPYLLIGVTSIVGALVGGMAALCGSFVTGKRAAIAPNP